MSAPVVTEEQIARIRKANQALYDQVRAGLNVMWKSVDLTDPMAAEKMLRGYVPVLVKSFGDQAALVAADWYEEVRDQLGVPGRTTVQMAEPMAAEYVRKQMEYASRHLYTPTPEAIKPFVDGVVQKYVHQAGQNTIARSADSDPEARGWQRKTRIGACRFCRMLEGRGGVYTETSVRFAAHHNCSCVAVPSWDPDAPEVPVDTYKVSETTSRMTEEQKKIHRARTRAYLNTMPEKDPRLSQATAKAAEEKAEKIATSEAIARYSTSEAFAINAALRRGQQGELSEDLLSALDNAFVPAPRRYHVRRVVSGQPRWEIGRAYSDGSPVRDLGYMSTQKVEYGEIMDQIEDFAPGIPKGQVVVMDIEVPRGFPIIDMGLQDIESGGLGMDQGEILLPRGTVFKVTDLEPDPDTGVLVATVKLLKRKK